MNEIPHAFRFLALGDSYTIGEGVAANERWPAQLAARLADAGFPVDPPRIIAATGWTTGELLAALSRERPSGPFALVTLQIGVNNQYRGLSQAAYRRDFRLLLAQAIALANGDAGRVIALSIPDWSVTPFASDRDRAAIADQIDGFNAVNRRETESSGCSYVDLADLSRRAGCDLSLLAPDLLHPSAAMYALWVDRLLETILVSLPYRPPKGLTLTERASSAGAATTDPAGR